MKGKLVLYLILVASGALLLASIWGDVVAQGTIEPEPTAAAEGEATSPPQGEGEAEIVTTRTPVPTATPGLIAEGVADLTQSLGLARVEFLGLSAEDWINLAISLLTVLVVYLASFWLLRRLLRRIVRRTPSDLDDLVVAGIGPQLRWLLLMAALWFATTRLTFVSADLKQLLLDVYFIALMWIVVQMAVRLISLLSDWYREGLKSREDADRLQPVIQLVQRVGIIVVIMVGVIILLSHFGVNVTALTATLGIAGLAFSLAAQDTLADAISGFTILVDQPFRVGDRIEIQGLGTWGDVVDIGTRTTRIRTRDNRMVIVPNSIIAKSQVVNYTYPDPRYRVQTHVGIGYDMDIEVARHLIVDTVRQVEGVLPDRPVEALYIEMGDSAMVFRVRWWIESYIDTRRVFDRVHTALQKALDAAGIDMPFPTQTLNVQFRPEAAAPIPPTLSTFG
jgi:MscS family membrane protein